jgi:divinyl chlorophyllide a 8-vinyl-reductase
MKSKESCIFFAITLLLGARKTCAFAPRSSRRPSYFSLSAVRSNTLYFANDITGAQHESILQGDTRNRKTVVVAGASGYIGKAVVRESLDRGYNTIALVRSSDRILSEEGQRLYGESFKGAKVVEADVCDEVELTKVLSKYKADTLVSCLASPVGTKKEAYAIDYQATLNFMNAGRSSQVQARHFILLSAFCCRNPILQLQQAKLKFEAELQKQTDLTYSIVRPTAFFKSVSGQFDAIKEGNQYVLFGDGAVTRCNPIAENELAEFMLNSMDDTNMQGKILNIGGPDEPLTNQRLGEMMYEVAGLKNPKFVYAPTWIFDVIINSFQFLATITKNEFLEDATEYARIGKYYAVEDMLTTAPEEKYGKITMMDHYREIAAKGQDPFTPM